MIGQPNLEQLNEVGEYLRYVPFRVDQKGLYTAETLYEGYDYLHPGTIEDAYDSKVYAHFLDTGKRPFSALESLARSLHDFCISNAVYEFLSHYDIRKVVGVMGGHGLIRTDEMFRTIALLSKRLTEDGFLMVSGGGPGAMEATHFGAWMAGRTTEELDEALQTMKAAPTYKNKGWMETAFEVIHRFPQTKYRSLGVPTWLYGHEPATPLATDIAKLFDNSIREDGLLTIAFGGVVYSPGSAGTMQEIFQDAVQNHYLSFGYASPMVFLGSRFWTEEIPVYPLLQHLSDSGKYQNLHLSLVDSAEEVVKIIETFE